MADKFDDSLFEEKPYQEMDDSLFEDAPAKEQTGDIKAALLGALEQGTLGFGDELGAAFQEPSGALKMALKYVPGVEPTEDADTKAYQRAKLETQAAMNKAYEQNPAAYGTGAALGIGATTLVPAGAVTKGASLLTKLAAMGATGALAGVGEAEGDLGDLATGAATGAALSAGIGAGISGAGKLGKVALDKIKNVNPRSYAGALKRTFEKGAAGIETSGPEVEEQLTKSLQKEAKNLVSSFKEGFKDIQKNITGVINKYANVPTELKSDRIKYLGSMAKNEILDPAAEEELSRLTKQLGSKIGSGSVGELENARKYLTYEVPKKTKNPDIINFARNIKSEIDSTVDEVISSYNPQDFSQLLKNRSDFRKLATEEANIFGKNAIRKPLDEDVAKVTQKAEDFLAKSFNPDRKTLSKVTKLQENIGTTPAGQKALATIERSKPVSEMLPEAFKVDSESGALGGALNLASTSTKDVAYNAGKLYKKIKDVSNLSQDTWNNLATKAETIVPELSNKLRNLSEKPTVEKSAALFALSQNPATRNLLSELLEDENE